MKGLNSDTLNYEISYLTESEEDENENIEEVEQNKDYSSQLDLFLENIVDKCKEKSNQNGNRISVYYLPELTKDVIRLCKDYSHYGHQSCKHIFTRLIVLQHLPRSKEIFKN